MDKKSRPFGVLDQIGYVCGDMAGSFVNLFVDAFFLTFCTYALGIDAGWMASLFLFSRLWDAINDPIIGSFPDRWKIGKSGDKFKPWIKVFMIPLGLSGVLCFMNVPFEGIALHAWVAFVYILYGMSYTGTSMPFGAMANVITNDPIERSKLSRARSIGGTFIGTFVLSAVPAICFDANSQIKPERFTMLAVVFGVLCVVLYCVQTALTPERVQIPMAKGEKFEYGKVLKAALKNRPLIGVMVATIGSMLFITGNSQLNSYIYKEVYQNTTVMSYASMLNLPVLLAAFVVVPMLVKKFGKRNIILISCAFSFAISLVKVLFRIEDVWVFMIVTLVGNFGQTVFTMLIWALVSDCLDYSEWKLGIRSDGSMYSLYTFSRKIGSTIASTGVAASLGLIGYVSGQNVVQSPETVSNIYYLVCIVPVITCILELVGIGFIFNLDKKTTDTMYAEMAERRKAGAK